MSGPVPIVYDVNILVGAAAGGNSPFRSWPSPPPTSGNPFADCLGIVVDAAEFALWTSPHLLNNTERVLEKALGWEREQIELYRRTLILVCAHSGGGYIEPPFRIADCEDWEDNRVLDLVTEVGALLVVSEDVDLTSMSPWRGTPILRAREFVAKVDAMRRHQRRT